MAEPSTRDEFIVEHKSIQTIQNNEAKIHRLFFVKVVYSSRNDSMNNFVWLRLEGDEENRRNAKEYIIALTKPAESKVLHFPAEMYDFGNQLFLENIEKQTRAYIEHFGSGSIRIHGTSLSVTLALSILEDKINNFINRKKTLGDTTTTKHRDVHYSSENGFRCSNNSPQKSFNEYNSKNTHSPHHVKHSIPKTYSHNNSNSSQDAMNNLFSLPRSQLQNGKNDTLSRSPSSANLRYSEMSGMSGNSGKDYPTGLVANLSSGELSLEGCQLSAERFTFFTNLAKQIGHVPSDIQEALKMASDDMKPSNFIRLLNNIKEDREIVEKEERENEGQATESDESKLPIRYIELLLNDFKEEAGISSIEELKRRNQARLQCLQQHTDHSKTGSPKDFFPQTGWDSTKKKKTKKKSIRMPDGSQMLPGTYTENEVSQINNERAPNLGLGHENGQALIDRIASTTQSYKSAVMSSISSSSVHHADESSNLHLRQPPMGKAHNASSHIYSDKHHLGSDPRTCISNRTDDQNARYLSPTTETNHLISNMDLEKNDSTDNDDLRFIVIDGSNIAMTHGNGKFSCKGIQIAVNYFVQRGHSVMVFVPQHKLCAPGPSNDIKDQDILYQLKETGHLAFTPSRKLQGRLINCYDDRFILSLAEREDGIIVSNDQYRDLMHEKASWKEIVENRLLMYTFANDNFMLPEDPLGRDGPILDDFLRKNPKNGNCTPKKSLRPPYRPQFVPQRQQPQPQPNYQILQRGRPRTRQGNSSHMDPSLRSQEETQNLYRDLKVLFPERDQDEILRKVLCDYPSERDPSRLSNSCIQIIFGN